MLKELQDNHFKGVKSILKGKEPFTPLESNDCADDGDNKGFPVNPYTAEEEIWKSFAKIKEVVGKIIEQATINHECINAFVNKWC